MSGWIVVAPHRAGDPALEASAWVAGETVARVAEAPTALTGADVTRASFERACQTSGPFDGVAFFGHGLADRLIGSDGEPLLCGDNIECLKRCWVHAYACLSGWSLADLAAANGAWVYVGYEVPIVALVPRDLHPDVHDALAELVTVVTCALHQGEVQGVKLRGAAAGARDRLIVAMARFPPADPTTGAQLAALAQQLVDDMVVK